MANHCINTKSKEFISLVDKTGANPIMLAAEIANWQQVNNSEAFPDMGYINDRLDTIKKSEDINTLINEWENLDNQYKQYGNIKIRRSNHRANLEGIAYKFGVEIKESNVTTPPTYTVTIPNPAIKKSEDINYNLSVISALSDIKDIRETIRLNTKDKPYIEDNLRKLLRGKGVVDNQINFIFDYMKSNNITEISTDDLAIELASNYSYVVKLSVARNQVYPDQLDDFTETLLGEDVDEQRSEPTKYYGHMTVPGGTNYIESEISTPAITPSIKGHAQFSTDKGIGWVRSDDRSLNQKTLPSLKQQNWTAEQMEEATIRTDGSEQALEEYLLKNYPDKTKGDVTKTRRILEVQSDLFQKGRDIKDLISGEDVGDGMTLINQKPKDDKANNFLQLLNKDNNWVTFFIKSIIQDSAKKGYEYVLFPKGDTASKVEGHETLEDFKKQKENRIRELQQTTTVEYFAEEYDNIKHHLPEEVTKQDYIDNKKIIIEDGVNEIAQLKDELHKVETEGFAALRPIYAFYENTVTNILNKEYKGRVNDYTDEYGNKWNQLAIDRNKDLAAIKLSQDVNIITASDHINNNTDLAKRAAELLGYDVVDTNTTITSHPVTKIISGAQTGVDMSGLDVGLELGIPTGGTAAAYFTQSIGEKQRIRNPELRDKYGLIEGKVTRRATREGREYDDVYLQRTIANAQEADGTLWFGNITSPGAQLTLDIDRSGKPKTPLAQKGKAKPLVNPKSAKEILDWLVGNNIKTLNVAGNREHTNPGIYNQAKNMLKEALTMQVDATTTKTTTGKQLSIFDIVEPTVDVYKRAEVEEFLQEFLDTTDDLSLNGFNNWFKQRHLMEMESTIEQEFGAKYPLNKFTFATVEHSNRLLSRIAYTIMDQLKGLTFGDVVNNRGDLKEAVVGSLEDSIALTESLEDSDITELQKKNIESILEDLRQDDSFLWDRFTNYFAAVYKFVINDPYELLNNKNFTELPTHWDDREILREDRRSSINSKIKFLLSRLEVGKNDITGLIELAQLDKLINRLISSHQFDSTPDDFLRTIERITDTEYSNLRDLLFDAFDVTHDQTGYKIGDKNLFNAYVSALNYHLPEVFALLTTMAHGLNITEAQIVNRDSFVKYRDYDTWISNITNLHKAGKLAFIYDRFADKRDIAVAQGHGFIAANESIKSFLDIDSSVEDYSYDYFKAMARLLNAVGITISADTLHNEYNSSKYSIVKGDEVAVDKKAFRMAVINPIHRIVVELYNTHANNEDYKSNEKSNIGKLATMNAKYSSTRVQLDYQNVNSDTVYTPIYSSFVGRFTKALNSIEAAIEFFTPYTEDKRLQYSNILWNKDDNGILNYDRARFAQDGVYVLDSSNPVNFNFTSGLNISMFNGMKNRTLNNGLEYTDLTDKGYAISTILGYLRSQFMIPSSDSSRIFSLQWDNAGRLNNTIQTTRRSTRLLTDPRYYYSLNTSNPIFNQIKNTVLLEVEDARIVANELFDIDNQGGLTVKKKYRSKKVNGIETNENLLKLHTVKHWDGRNLLNNGVPTGKVFQFGNLTYKMDGKLVTLNDVVSIADYLMDSNNESFDLVLDTFIYDAINNNIKAHIDYYKTISPILMTQAKLAKTGYKEKSKKVSKDDLMDNLYFKTNEEFHKEVANFYLDNYLAQVEIKSLFNGNISEYKDANDENKRVGHSIKNGAGTIGNRQLNYIVVNDIIIKSKFKGLIKRITNKNADSYDGITIITEKEFRNRAEEYGRKDELEGILDYLNDLSKPFDINEYERLVESQKYFYYGREQEPVFNSLVSKQFKNSTIVLTKRMVNMMELQDINDWMERNGIDELHTDGARKVGGEPVFNLFNDKGRIHNTDIDPSGYIRQNNINNLIIQLDVKPHALDSQNKAGIQLQKQILNNIDLSNPTYSISGEGKITGLGIKNHFHNLLDANIHDSVIALLKRFDAVENNEIKYIDEGGIKVIDINKTKLLDFLRDYVNTNEVNETLKLAIGSKGSINTNIPLFSSLTYKKFRQILLALFTNNVTNQKLPGMHLPIVPEMGLNVAYDKSWIEYFEDPTRAIDYVDSVKDAILKGERDAKLQLVNKGDHIIVEAILPPHMKEFYTDGGRIDINDLSDDAREMIGIRIPTEGKQSMIYLNVIGWHKTGASQAILPYELVNKTGWDFDIDTIYIYHKTIERNSDGIYEPVEYLDNNNSTVRQRYDIFINSTEELFNNRVRHSERLTKAYNRIVNSKAQLDSRLSKKKDDATTLYNEGIDAIADLKQARLDILKLIKDNAAGEWSRSDNTNTILQQFHDMLAEIDSEIENISDEIGKSLQDIESVKARRSDRVKELWNDVNLIKDDIKNEVSAEYPYDDFKKLSIEQQNTKTARNNRIIDVYKSILSNPKHQAEYWKPNNSDNIKAVGDFVNSLWSNNITGLNTNNFLDYNRIRDLNMSVRTLKGNSVAFDSIMAIFGVLGVNTSDKITFSYNKGDYFTNKSTNKIATLVDNVTDSTVSVSKLANSNSMNWMDINDTNINEQTSEVTANILDAVKVLMGFNINENTLGVFRVLSSTSFSSMFEGKPNRFVIPYLFTHQPIVVDLSRAISLAKIQDPNVQLKNVRRNIINNYKRNILKELSPYIHAVDKGLAEKLDTRLSKYNSVYLSKEELTIINGIINNITNSKGVNLDASMLNSNRGIIPSAEDLISNIQTHNGLEGISPNDKIDYYLNQIVILTEFDRINDIAMNVVKAITTFNTDKLGAGPDFNVSRNLIRNIIDLHISENKLIAIGNELQLFDKNQVRDLFRSIEVLSDPFEILQQYNKFLELYDLDARQVTPFTVDSLSLVESVYPKLFDSNKESTYKSFESFLMDSNFTSMDAFINMFPHEYNDWYKLKRSILAPKNLIGNEYYEQLFNNYVNSVHTNSMDFFTKSNNDAIIHTVKDHESKTGIRVDINYLEKKLLFGNTDTKIRDINLLRPSDKDRAYFLSASLSTKIRLLLNNDYFKHYISLPKFDGNHIMNYVVLNDDQNTYDRVGYSSFRVSRSGDPKIMQESFTDMLLSNNELIRITAQEMIKAHNYLHGITFGNNISQYIDAQLLYRNDNNINSELNLRDYAAHLDNVTNQEVDYYVGDNFHKSNWNDKRIVPDAKPVFDNNDNINNDHPIFYPSFYYELGSINNPIGQIIIESYNKISDSKYDKYDFVLVDVGGNPVLYKRYNSASNPQYVYYYPVNRMLPNETDKLSGIESYNKYAGTNTLYTEDTYKTAIELNGRELAKSDIQSIMELVKTRIDRGNIDDTSYDDRIKKSENINEDVYNYEGSTLDLINDLSNKVDLSVYIGNDNDISYKAIAKNRAVLNIDDDERSIVRSINKLIKTNDIDFNMLMIGEDSITQSNKEKLHRVMNSLIEHNLDKHITIHTINNSDVNTAVRHFLGKNRLITYNNNKKLHEDVNPKYSLSDYALTVDSHSYEDITKVNKELDALVGSLHKIVAFSKINADLELDYKNSLETAVRNATTSDYIPEILTSRDLNGIKEAFDVNVSLIQPFTRHIGQLYDEVKDINYQNLHKLNADEKSDIARKIRTITQISSIIRFIDNLNHIDPARANNVDHKLELITDINNKIDALKEEYAKIQNIVDNSKSLIHKLMSGLVSNYTTNSNFISEHSTILSKFDSEGIKIDDTDVTINMSIDEEIAQFTKILTENEEMSWMMMNMDSAFDTTITIIDTVLQQYIAERGMKHRKVRDRLIKADKLLKEMFGKGIDDARNTSVGNSMEDTFRRLFVNKKGYLVSKYNWSDVYEDIQKARDKSYAAYLEAKPFIETMRIYKEQGITGVAKTELSKRIGEIMDRNHIEEWLLENLTDTIDNLTLEGKELAEILEIKNRFSDNKLFNKELNKRKIILYQKSKNGIKTDVYVKLQLKDTYLDKGYRNLTENQREWIDKYRALIHEVIESTYPNDSVSENFIPFATKETNASVGRDILGIVPLNHDKIDKIFDEEFYYELDKPMMNYARTRQLINYAGKAVNESQADYVERIVSNANSKYKKKFKTIEDIDKYNIEAEQYNKDFFEKHRDFNPASILSQFIRKSTEREYTKRFESTLMLLINTLASPEYQERVKTNRGRVVDKIWKQITDKNEYLSIKGTDTTGYKRIVEWLPAFFGISNINTRLDQGANIAKNVTSFVFMGANVLGGIKNVMTGYQNEIMEAVGREFINSKDLIWSTKEYMKNAVDIIRSLDNDFSDNLFIALIKSQPDLLELRDTRGDLVKDHDQKRKLLKKMYNSTFFAMNSTEHFMQYTMLLASMKSHRVIEGKVMNFFQFKSNNREKILLDILPDDLKASFLEFKKKAEHRKSRPNDDYDYVTTWTARARQPGYLTKDQLREFNTKRKTNDAIVQKNFDKYDSVYDSFELRDGFAEIKKGSTLTDSEYQLFGKKMQSVNQKLHGVYNKIDRMALRNVGAMNLAFQFRSWVKPNWDRFMGKRFGRSVFSEALGTYQKGAYVSLYDFMMTPIHANKSYGANDIKGFEGLHKMLTDYVSFLMNAKLYYNRLSDHEKANVRRAVTNVTFILTTALSLQLLGALAKGFTDDEDIIQNKMLAFTIYELNMFHSEISQFVPFMGWYGFYQRTRQHPLAAEKVFVDTIDLVSGILKYPFQSDDARVYQRGPYKDRSRVDVQLNKLIPVYRQVHKWNNLGMYTGWYKMYNPFSDTFSFIDNDKDE